MGWVLQDFKVTSCWSVKHALDKVEWAAQLNCYALMLREHSFDVTGLQIVAICRDWRKNDAKKYGHEGYPLHQVVVIPFPLWPSRVTREFMSERVALHRNAREVLPFCSPEERWQKRAMWAVMRDGRKSAVKLYPTAREAHEAVQDKRLYVEERPAVAVRCQDYCSVRDQCLARSDGQFQPGDLTPASSAAA